MTFPAVLILSVSRDKNCAIAYRFQLNTAERYGTNSIGMAMHDNAKNRRLLAGVIVAAGLTLTLCGCSTSGGDGAGRLLVAPDKFVLFSCPQLEQRAIGVASRKKQLEQLMAKAGTTPDGRIASALAYQAEYTETVADLSELHRAAAEKNCKPIPVLTRTAPAR